jgi:signal transduction histidine kinase/DNA-binding NarL/FixJ family response regulator
MFGRVSWRLLDPVVLAGAILVVLYWILIGLAQAFVQSDMLLVAGILTSGLIVTMSARIARANARLAISERRLASLQLQIAQQTQHLEHARRAADAQAGRQRHFFASVSHELRTPLGGVIGLSRVLLDTPLSGDQRRSITAIVSCSEALLTIVNDILDSSKIEAGKLDLRPVTFDLHQTLVDLIALVSAGSGAKGVAIRLFYPADAPVWFSGDVGRIRQIATNLIGNAMKFTTVGEVGVVVATPHTGDLTVAVIDTGPGLTGDQVARIFDEFVQLDATREGTGLGLPISKRLAELMGGRIDVVSTLGVGSTFTLTLPLPQAEPAAALPDRTTTMTAPIGSPMLARRRVKVLAADDNKTNRQVLKSMLKTESVDLVLACDGADAAEMYLEADPDVILMDVWMPGLDGYEATRHIRDQERRHGRRRVPIIALTANALRGDRDKCLMADMDDYMTKPLLKPVLLAMIERWSNPQAAPLMPVVVQERRKARTGSPDQRRQRGAVGASSAPDQSPVVDEARIAALITDLGADALGLIVAQFERDIAEALERLAVCVTASNSVDVRQTLHLIRSCASNLGITRIVQICNTIEGAQDCSAMAPHLHELTLACKSAQSALASALECGNRRTVRL